MEQTTDLEVVLQEHFSVEYSRIVGRGATAIYLLLRALGLQGEKVALPAVCCPAVLYPVCLAGCEPVFCDVTKNGFYITADELSRVGEEQDIAAVIGVHSFGYEAPMADLKRWCKKNGVFLIEDLCQLFPSHGFEVVGDAAIVSFGHTKPVDCGGWGGVLVNDCSLAESISQLESGLPARMQADDEYRDAYYTILKLYKRAPETRVMMSQLSDIYENLFVHRLEQNSTRVIEILDSISNLETLNAERLRKTRLYETTLKKGGIKKPVIGDKGIPWRYTFCLDDESHQAGLTEWLREKDCHVSNWYPNLAADWGKGDDLYPSAVSIEKSIINLWVDRSVTDRQVRKTAEHVLGYFDSIR